jgi:uncharacterized protein DUF2607
MKNHRPRLLLSLTPAIVIAALAVSSAHAGTHPSGHLLPHSSPVLWNVLAMLGVLAVALVRLGRRGRTTALLSLAFLVALFGFQTAVHSVHHLSDPHAAASCAIFAASQHVPGDCPEALPVAAPIWTAAPGPVVVSEPFHLLETFGSPEGRAPPAPSSV